MAKKTFPFLIFYPQISKKNYLFKKRDKYQADKKDYGQLQIIKKRFKSTENIKPTTKTMIS